MEHQTRTYEQPQMDVVLANGGGLRWMSLASI